ncbi:glycerophosphodiester phosphodiesterase [Candidatus Sumerlaeota bacterium]|nr:glycerophosphodiester phosphodiesterase [Candidatus Sumerlaeota bacterium]
MFLILGFKDDFDMRKNFRPLAMRSFFRLARLCAACALIFTVCAIAFSAGAPAKKICIAHRGASAHAPEHTEASYRKAMEMGADFVEQDLALSKDGVLICIHDTTLERTTNVAEVYPKRNDRADPTGGSRKSWRVADFTLAELKKLDAGTWFDPAFAGAQLLTFQEAIDIVKTKPGTGIYPEIKDSAYHARLGFDIEAEVLKVLKANGLDTKEGQAKMPVIIQSFEPEALKKIRKLTGDTYFLIQLVDLKQAKTLMGEVGMPQVAKYANGFGPAIPILIGDRKLVDAAHKLGMVLHPYTVNEKAVHEPYPDIMTYAHFILYEIGADGCFIDNPDQFPRK